MENTSPTWNEYQNALNIVKAFEEKRKVIRKNRKVFNYQRTYNDIVWYKRMELAKEQLVFEKFTIEQKELHADFIDDTFKRMKTELLRIRVEAQKHKQQK